MSTSASAVPKLALDRLLCAYSKTAKGLAELLKKDLTLATSEIKVLALVDGLSTGVEIGRRLTDMNEDALLCVLNSLELEGFIRALPITSEENFSALSDPALRSIHKQVSRLGQKHGGPGRS